MMSKKLLTGLFAAGLSIGMLAVSSTASAQYIGPTRIAPTTVNKVLKSPVDDQYVLLSGKITSQVSKDKYTFTDKTGSIVVEIDNEVFAGRQVGPIHKSKSGAKSTRTCSRNRKSTSNDWAFQIKQNKRFAKTFEFFQTIVV